MKSRVDIAPLIMKIHLMVHPELIGQNQFSRPVIAARESGRKHFIIWKKHII